MGDVADWTQAVNITGGSVVISGTASVSIVGTVPVSISSGSVSITGTVPVSISSGSVSITGTPNINIQSQSVTVNVALPWRSVGSLGTGGGGALNFTTSAVGTGAQSLGILMAGNGTVTNGLTVQGTTTGSYYEINAATRGTTGWVTVPINAAADSTYIVSWATASAAQAVNAYASDLAMGFPALGQEAIGGSLPVAIAQEQTFDATSVGSLIAFTNIQRAIGTYNFDIYSALPYRGLVYFVTTGPEAGTTVFTSIARDTNIGGDFNLLVGPNLAANNAGNGSRVYPGIAAVANQAASDICGRSPRIKLVVTVLAMTQQCRYQLAP